MSLLRDIARRCVVYVPVVLGVASCGQGDGAPAGPGALRLVRVSGDEQEGIAGSRLARPLVVAVWDKDGHRQADQPVTFEVVSGDATVEPDSALTDITGMAATWVVLGSLADTVRVRASAPGEDAWVDFTASAAIQGAGAHIQFVWVEPGTFTMGSPSSEMGRSASEDPKHEVTISRGFWLGKYEITQAEWESVMGGSPWGGKDHVVSAPRHPAVYASWSDVQEFIGRLNRAAGESLYRLPTEAEWEYACRAGTTTPWSCGSRESQLGDHAWYFDNAWEAGLEHAQPVGAKLPNPWGLFDMHGNVYEWCDDWFGPYSGGPQADPSGPSTGSDRVVRGGGFDDGARTARSAYRHPFAPGQRFDNVGARLVKTE
ncbi:formylglycine-generating enzyme family protein [Candidatus Latescibacterota bacterium]